MRPAIHLKIFDRILFTILTAQLADHGSENWSGHWCRSLTNYDQRRQELRRRFLPATRLIITLIAKNAGVNGSVVSEKVLATDDARFGYNAATDTFEDLMSAGIIYPTK
ncbi:hypothetical protein M8C21_008180, partial [Ambrosia artemisiifolia]